MQVPSFNDIQQERYKLFEMIQVRWESNVVFSWEWWLLLTLCLLPWFVWWKMLNKEEALPILFYGLIIMLGNFILDNIGTDLQWWGYPIKLAPFFPPLITPDFTIIPILMMFIYQWFQPFKSFVIANFILSLIIAFIGEPLFIWLGYYELGSWKLFYSFIYYNLFGLFAKWLTQYFANLNENTNKPSP
ncbi:CBO0543 family protein [Pontibacillus marinus]|uniref:Uncharacterized protein n=1 Tax=Pontibacillus marinus BH030004 = DSM 16465 TaxID=1385511 RepID=A0A0A5G266_9BACI|nr:CBO0543 family protein [Pontibacillus marinus]KGX85238.1 hypothetical protein N783_15040 [Pontibacillus marinus BH030004 = DSM 16465]